MNNMKLIMENWRGFQALTEVTSLKESEILIETRTMKLTLEELDKSYKAKKISKQSYQKTLRESIIYDFKIIQKYMEENKHVLFEEKWNDESDEEYVPKEKDPNSFMSRMGRKFASGWLSVKKKILENVFKFFKLIGTSKDGNLNFIGKAAKKVAKFNDRFKKDHPMIHGAIKALVILAVTLAICKFVAGAAGLDAAAERVGRTAVKGGMSGLKDAAKDIPMPPETKEPAQLLMSLDPEAGQHPVIQACAGGGKVTKQALVSLPDHVDKVTDKAAAAAETAGVKADAAKQIARETRRKVQAAVAEKASAAADAKVDAATSSGGSSGLSSGDKLPTKGIGGPRIMGANPESMSDQDMADAAAAKGDVATSAKVDAATSAKADAATSAKADAVGAKADSYSDKPDPSTGRVVKTEIDGKQVYVTKAQANAIRAKTLKDMGFDDEAAKVGTKADKSFLGGGDASAAKADAASAKADAVGAKADAVGAKADTYSDKPDPATGRTIKTQVGGKDVYVTKAQANDMRRQMLKDMGFDDEAAKVGTKGDRSFLGGGEDAAGAKADAAGAKADAAKSAGIKGSGGLKLASNAVTVEDVAASIKDPAAVKAVAREYVDQLKAAAPQVKGSIEKLYGLADDKEMMAKFAKASMANPDIPGSNLGGDTAMMDILEKADEKGLIRTIKDPTLNRANLQFLKRQVVAIGKGFAKGVKEAQ